jgi:phosphoserine aminotransferase
MEMAEADLRELLAIPANYKVLFLQGGAIQQFAIVPMNLLRGGTAPTTSNTGEWSQKRDRGSAQVRRRSTSPPRPPTPNYSYAIPTQDEWKLTRTRRLRALHCQRDHRRRGVPLDAGKWAACRWCRHVLAHPVAPDRRVASTA